MSRTTGKRRLSRRITIAMWICAGFFCLGYFPTAIWKTPVIAMVVSTAAVIPIGGKSPTVIRGALRGALLGAFAGFSALGAMSYRLPVLTGPSAPTTRTATSTSASEQPSGPASSIAPASPTQPDGGPAATTQPIQFKELTEGQLWRLAGACVGGTALLCAAVAGIFAQAAQSRRRAIDREWDSLR
jgi:hypothetical protein